MKENKGRNLQRKNILNQFDSLFNHLAEIIIITDLNGIIETINKPISGHCLNDLIGKNISEVIGDEGINKLFTSVINTGITKEFKYINSKNSKSYSVEIGSIGISGKINRIFLILKEVPKKKASEIFNTSINEFVNKLVNIAQIIVLMLDKKGRIIMFNPYLENLIGYKLNEVKGKNWVNTFIPKEDQSRIKKVFKNSINDVAVKGIINSIITKDGQQRIIEWYDSTLKDLDGNIVTVLAFGHDITERIEAENDLLTSKTQLVTALKIAKIGYWEFDTTNGLFIFNDHFYSVFHSTADKVGGYTMSVDEYIGFFVHPDDRQYISNFINNGPEMFKSAEDQHVEHKVIFGDGQIGYVSVRIIITKDENGSIKMFGANQDITERIRFEETIRKSEAQLSNAMKIAHLGCWEYDVASNLFTFNDNFYSIFQTSVELVGGYTMTPEEYANRFLYPDDRIKVIEETNKALETDDPSFCRQLEHRIIYADGEIGYISVRIFIVKDKEGRTIKTFGANQDITEQKRIEKVLEDQNKNYAALNQKLEESLDIVKKMNIELELAKNKAEENDKLKSAFLANLSHEIRTPMNGIIGFAKMLNKKGLSDERRLQYTEIINEMSYQLLHIIDEIIEISKIETGQIEVYKNKTNINDVLLRLFSIHKSTAEKNNINLYIQKGLPDDRSEIYTDNSKLRQILDNLLRNAIKYTHQGYVKFGYQLRDDSFIEFYVEDSGIGIQSEMQLKIFERFRQVDNGAARLYGGTGLGLSISKAFIEKLGGTIWIKSEEAKGSIFYFTIPYEPLKQQLVVNREKNNPKTPIILIVEDEEINYLYLEEVLLDSDIKILHAKRGSEAIDIFTKNPFVDIVLLDIKLPDINGIEIMKKMKGLRPNIPVIAQTAYALAGDMENAINSGFDDYISKPIDDQVLLNKIGYYLNRK